MSVGNSRAVIIDTFETRAARGASKETVKNARGYVRKLQGKRAKAKTKDKMDTPVSASLPVASRNSAKANAVQTAPNAKLLGRLTSKTEIISVYKENL